MSTIPESSADAPAAAGPVGAGDYVVRQGECADSIAYEHGHLWQTIWNDPANAALRQARTEAGILLPGDQLTIPPLRRKEVAGATEQCHRFRRKGVPAKLRLRLLTPDHQPRANEAYTLDLEGALFHGTCDGDGWIEQPIPPSAHTGVLIIGPDRWELNLGHLDPVECLSGVQARLRNLGYHAVPVDGEPGPQTAAALRDFQARSGLAASGEPDAATRQKLVEAHGS